MHFIILKTGEQKSREPEASGTLLFRIQRLHAGHRRIQAADVPKKPEKVRFSEQRKGIQLQWINGVEALNQRKGERAEKVCGNCAGETGKLNLQTKKGGKRK